MPEWIKPAKEEILVAHISDLHFGSHNQSSCWKKIETFLKKVQPSLVLVTGDLVDTPKETHYRAARTALDNLGVHYYVCAGNHDRHLKGNRLTRRLSRHSTAAFFDQEF